MNKEMIISSGDHETRVAILEDDQVVEVFIERERQRGVVGNIYKGRVSKVLPGMQSSFVDIGLERDAFLYVTEVVNTVEEFDRLESGDDEDAEPLMAAVSPPPTDRGPDASATRPWLQPRRSPQPPTPSRQGRQARGRALRADSRDDRDSERPKPRSKTC